MVNRWSLRNFLKVSSDEALCISARREFQRVGECNTENSFPEGTESGAGDGEQVCVGGFGTGCMGGRGQIGSGGRGHGGTCR